MHTPWRLARGLATLADGALERLGAAGGLATPGLVIVDPACGPGAFLAAALAIAGDRESRPAALLGLDLDAQALDDAEDVLRGASDRSHWPLRLERRDTLASLSLTTTSRPIPERGPLLVLGNPPWAGRTANADAEASAALLEDFRRDEHGARLEERKLGVLSDDYVRFFRWSAEMVRRRLDGGVLALVTNGSFLDGPVHRGMRAALTRWFDRVDIVDLGGNALIGREPGRDDNVFGVRPSVALTVALRRPGPEPRRGRVTYTRLRGSTADKLEALASVAPGRELAPTAPLHVWVPVEDVGADYDGWPSLAELVPFHREGVQTNRDAVVVDTDPTTLLARLEAFAAGAEGPELAAVTTAKRHYDPEKARRKVREALEAGVRPRAIAYRPFDERWFLPVSPLCHRPRPALLAAMRTSAFALLTVRKDRGSRPWRHLAVTAAVPDNCYLSNRSSCRTRAFPTHTADGRPNLSEAALRPWAQELGRTPSSVEVLRYAVAVLASERFQRRFAGRLRLDYPRLPPPDAAAFTRVCAAGEQLVAAFVDPGQGAGGPVTVGHVAVVASERVVRAIERVDRAVAHIDALTAV